MGDHIVMSEWLTAAVNNDPTRGWAVAPYLSVGRIVRYRIENDLDARYSYSHGLVDAVLFQYGLRAYHSSTRWVFHVTPHHMNDLLEGTEDLVTLQTIHD